MSERVVARDSEGRAVRIDDVVETIDTGNQYRVIAECGGHVCRVELIEANLRTPGSVARQPFEARMDLSFRRVRRVPTPQADEGEVRGWHKAPVDDWPYYSPDSDHCRYRICQIDAGCTRNKYFSESAKEYFARGRPLTLREVVDILAPEIKDVPGPAAQRLISAAERSAAVREAAQPAAVGAVCAECESTTPTPSANAVSSPKVEQPAPLPKRCESCDAMTAAVYWEEDLPYCVYCWRRTNETRESGPGIAVAPVEDVEPDDAQWASATWES